MLCRAPATLIAASLLAACEGGGAAAESLPEGAIRIACATGGAGGFTDDCAVEAAGAAAREFVIWHSDGAFRRFERLDDGRWIVPADGADGAEAVQVADGVELRVAGDRYRLPSAVFDHGGE